MTSRDTIEAQLCGLLQRAIPEPPKPIDAASIRTVPVAVRPAIRWAAPALSAACVLAVSAAISLFVLHNAHDGSTAIDRSPDAAAVNAQRHAATSVALQRTLASFTVPSTWRPSTRSLSKDLVLPTDDPKSYLVSRARLWVTSEGADTAIDYLTSHLPNGITPGNSVPSTRDFASFILTPTEEIANTSAYGGMSLSAFAERLNSRSVGVYLGASAYWLPVRTADQTIPADVTAAAVTLTAQMNQKVHRGRLDTADARILARAINELAVTYQAPSTCPVPGPTATITFTSPDGPHVVTVSRFCPAGVFVQPQRSGMELDLELGHVYGTILKMLGSPAGFGPP